ncbi:MAG: FliG C-terminal domain-containing protein [Planctomycetota bacterium]
MNTIPKSERLALLLSLLGDEAADVALSSLQSGVSEQVTTSLADFRQNPPSEHEIEIVLSEFESYFRFALETASESLNELTEAETAAEADVPATIPGPAVEEEERFELYVEPVKKFTQPELTGSAAHDLKRLHPYQVAAAIKNDQPGTISLVLRHLPVEFAAKTVEYLPEAIRPVVFLELNDPTTVSPLVIERILQTTLRLALEIEERETEEDTVAQMADLMRSLPRDVRSPMLQEVLNTDEELARELKSKLYCFEDIEKLSDRDVQTVLRQTNTDSLLLALQGAEDQLVSIILKNVSKRARETLMEEMAYKTDSSKDEIDAGRAEIVKVLIELDESGAITVS